jgi:hypothetical protein
MAECEVSYHRCEFEELKQRVRVRVGNMGLETRISRLVVVPTQKLVVRSSAGGVDLPKVEVLNSPGAVFDFHITIHSGYFGFSRLP